MIVYKKRHRTTEQKIGEYDSIIKFYENNRKGRFQSKDNLEKISNEIDLELDKDHKIENLNELNVLKNRINKFSYCPFSLGKRD